MKLLKLFALVMFISVFIFACNEAETNTNVKNTNTNENSAENTIENNNTETAQISGEKLYKMNCAQCHQDDGSGGKVEIEGKTLSVDDLTTEKMKKEPDAEYIEYMVKGIPDEGMPSFKDVLSDEEMKEIVKFIREDLQK